MGKHDIGTPINESLERHYQEEIKRLNNRIKSLEALVDEGQIEAEKLRFRLRLKDVEIESLVKALAE